MKRGEYNDKVYFQHEENDFYMYWDGRDRWIIGPELGASIHEAKLVGGAWAFSTDGVVTPDMIDEPFSVVEPDSDGYGWIIDPQLFIVDKQAAEEKRQKNVVHQTILAHKRNVSQGVAHRNKYIQKLKELWLKALAILYPEKEKESRTFTKDVLIALTASQISFRWKDLNIEYLAPFREFLLKGLQTYNVSYSRLL